MNGSINIPEEAQHIKMIVRSDVSAKRQPVYIALPIFEKPVVKKFQAFNVTEQAESDNMNAMGVTVDEFKAAFDFANLDGKDADGNDIRTVDEQGVVHTKERSEYRTELEKFIDDGVLSLKFYKLAPKENGEWEYVEIEQSEEQTEPEGPAGSGASAGGVSVGDEF